MVGIEQVSNANLKVRFTEEDLKRKNEIGQMAGSMQNMIDRLKDIVTNIAENAQNTAAIAEELTATAQNTNNTSKEVSDAVENIAEGAGSQAEETQTAAINIEENSNMLRDMFNQMNSLIVAVEDIEHKKDEGQIALKKLTELISLVKDKSEEVNNVIIDNNDSVEQISDASNMIQSIADQTNLLALNAAIDIAVVM